MRALYNLPAPAKINWFLHVTGRRPDGYHTLQTVFQFIDWCDSLDLIRRDDGIIRRIGADELPQDDLCVRAARLLQEFAQCTQCASGVDIHLRKRIPQQAGLGGGSSDAATVLIGLNRLWGLDLPRATLMQIALRLGADVPLFIFGRNAWAEGVGEQLREIELPTPIFAVVHPARGLSTRAVFCALDLTTPKHEETIAGFAEWLESSCSSCAGPQKGLGSLWGGNDLQAGAVMLEPLVGEVLERVGRWVGGESALRFGARMTGSGSAVFAWVCPAAGVRNGALGEASAQASVRLADLPAGWQGRLCEGLREHPLRGWVDA
ncbi:MAG: 4-(cytidine 5'-diphospho)-2-C-methyl-D-erythritol kinase [Thiomonas sp.]|uniref:4-(cytidine 5'-diphospho)-2-C-methyl-D-erythritol kinase n=1 Tax=Thiomonas sp. TaxID=2047785 RepID=UPI002A35A3B6|nr:4-(cytidine 5'-diphospho)-2-C-methyl-D-erythritol kinase [Thiomonas sp.]MDY0330487.1 4-(cytidine 5'-diphospho)-2-C-methyl-D-erythritol kinase [Thiomonas sp.]